MQKQKAQSKMLTADIAKKSRRAPGWQAAETGEFKDKQHGVSWEHCCRRARGSSFTDAFHLPLSQIAVTCQPPGRTRGQRD